MKASPIAETDFVVIGAGVAGLRAAVELAASGRVLVLAKAELSESATAYAQGGVAVALSDEDEIGLHFQDTINAGDGLCHVEAVKAMVEEGPQCIQQLIEWGTEFDREGTKLAFTKEGAHSRSRVLHAHGDSTGREISRALFAKVKALPSVHLLPFFFTTDLIVEKGKVVGVRGLDEQRGTVFETRAQAVLLATGGLGQIFGETTNPEVATGDGVAIAYRAGAELSDMEFVQFHPTALHVKGAPRFLLSEALRGEGGKLCNVDLEPFMHLHHEAGDLAPRDVVARSILLEMGRTSADFVYLDMTGLDPGHLKKRFPRIYETCLRYNLDITTDLIPVRPAAHYSMGGVRTDLFCCSSLPGLYAAGEVACTGVHGANRLASNSLLEGIVFGARAGRTMVADVKGAAKARAAAAGASSSAAHAGRGQSNGPVSSRGGKDASRDGAIVKRLREIQSTMSREVGIIRTGKELEQAIEQLEAMPIAVPEKPTREEHELLNMWTVAKMIARCALAREESRGAHYRSDFPYRSEALAKHSVVSKDQSLTFV
jgi:L-aspartate oxidase